MGQLHQITVVDGYNNQGLEYDFNQVLKYATSPSHFPGDIMQTEPSGGTDAGQQQMANSGFLVDGETIRSIY